MKQKNLNRTIASLAAESSKDVCFFTGEEFEIEAGKLHFTFNEKSVSPQYAYRQGFAISDDIQLPKSIKNRRHLSSWLQEDLSLRRDSEKWKELFCKFGPDLDPGYPVHPGYTPPNKY